MNVKDCPSSYDPVLGFELKVSQNNILVLIKSGWFCEDNFVIISVFRPSNSTIPKSGLILNYEKRPTEQALVRSVSIQFQSSLNWF